ncbi:type VI secretion system secreted protein VgrG [Paraburkholderia caballeronis]|uniref:type VI secretion system Vgr family protein n=1 Tax=Paraburkholderia caballeronis TaxID=416943 RepID=UPI001066FC14|nr:type VI secretion system secreted protein VgrG [Paraburkholderia caballeronis]
MTDRVSEITRDIRRYLTGRQSAHLKFTPRKLPPKRDSDVGKPPQPMPEVSVVSWEVREAFCEPYVIKAVVSVSQAVSRRKLVGQFADFTIQPDDERQAREFSGLVTKFESLTESRDGCTYRVVIRQYLAMLDGPSNCATYQNKSSAEIIQEVLERNDIDRWMDVRIKLRRKHPKHRFRFQFNMGDWNYIRLEMEQAGLFCYIVPGTGQETLVIADDVDGYLYPPIPVLDRPSSGLATSEESIDALRVTACTVPESFVVADYNRENAWERLRSEGQVQVDTDDCTMMGTPYVWGTGHKDAAGAEREAELRHEAAYAHQVRYKAKSTVLAIRPGCVVEPDQPLEDCRWGMVVTRVVHRGAREESYRNTFRAIPANRAYRMPVDPSRWPRIHGTLSATICSPDDYKYAYITAEGEYIARLHPDFGKWPKGGESMPLRVAKVYAGRHHTGLHIPARDGDEAIVSFDGGDPNRPYISGFHHNSQRPDLINSSRRRLSRSELRTQSGNKFWLDDWEGQEGVELSTEHSGRSQLHLGHIVDATLGERGNGAELRTSGHWVGRGGKGVMLTAYDQPGGFGQVRDTTETKAQLDGHARLADTLAQSAEASKASPADVSAQRAISADLNEVKKPGVLVTGPGPVGIVSGDGVQLASDGSIIATSKKGMHFSTLKRFTAAVGGVVSLFA